MKIVKGKTMFRVINIFGDVLAWFHNEDDAFDYVKMLSGDDEED